MEDLVQRNVEYMECVCVYSVIILKTWYYEAYSVQPCSVHSTVRQDLENPEISRNRIHWIVSVNGNFTLQQRSFCYLCWCTSGKSKWKAAGKESVNVLPITSRRKLLSCRMDLAFSAFLYQGTDTQESGDNEAQVIGHIYVLWSGTNLLHFARKWILIILVRRRYFLDM